MKKKILLALASILAISQTTFAGPRQIWVSPEAAESGDGSFEAPHKRIAAAQRQARELRRLHDDSISDGIEILLADGKYELIEPLLVRTEDSGTADSPTVFKAAAGASPILSGGVEVTGWRRAEVSIPGLNPTAKGKLWVAKTPRKNANRFSFRQLWVEGERAVRAQEVDNDDLKRILDWDKEERVGWIELPEFGDFSDPEGMEFVIHQMWAIAILRVKTLEAFPDEGRARISFHEPESRVQFEHPWPPVVLANKGRPGFYSADNGSSAYYLANRIEFLDEPGEWYLDENAGLVYYWPKDGQDMASAEVVAPAMETLVTVEGSLDAPVTHVQFDGIRFEHTTWLRPSQAGHVPLQAGFYMYDAYKLKIPGTPDKAKLENQAWIGRQPAAVSVYAGDDIVFKNCVFQHLAASGLDYLFGSQRAVVEGNVFRDIGGNGVVIGSFQDGGIETHVPYDPADEREICSDARISNNLVTDVATEDWGCVGIAAGYVRGIEISHNEISHVAYTGISMGWGWTRSVNCMRNNRIHANHIHHFAKHMYDVGGIYTLSPQPKSVISENSIHSLYTPAYVHDPNHWNYLYLDEGSSFIYVRDNWCPAQKFSTNANGPGNTWENNGPEVSEEIKAAAGLEAEFKGLLDLN
ncbi:right-handed parallel beta-helix repeat-containing protein [Pelagicoccus sp. SDUM812005]|uniref:right-handed parallel beta-helix repeat-containing protein n=1 Tax=Pelagicoccus sp. SDUM812005 TaxID=3041257 RepID=UPI00280F4226|nr:right-handed parallel beta-helix repeat-containing protein [Pelagicoccus sp. SDUM812005]MDQ8179140.1 right-handed parallel beta-helix repeat-containing protein [Pelagicoccus sp. SDUM812005]